MENNDSKGRMNLLIARLYTLQSANTDPYLQDAITSYRKAVREQMSQQDIDLAASRVIELAKRLEPTTEPAK